MVGMAELRCLFLGAWPSGTSPSGVVMREGAEMKASVGDMGFDFTFRGDALPVVARLRWAGACGGPGSGGRVRGIAVGGGLKVSWPARGKTRDGEPALYSRAPPRHRRRSARCM